MTEQHHRSPEIGEPHTEEPAIARLIDNAPTEDEASAIRSLCESYGDAAVAYLSDPVGDVNSPTLERDFIDAYLGSYDNPADYAWGLISDFGWDTAVEELRTKHGIPAVLHWDIEDLLLHLNVDGYYFIEQGGKTHVFAP